MESTNIVTQSIITASNGKIAYCKFLSANDTGETNAHQAGIYIAKSAVPVIFNCPGVKGENKDRWVVIKWQDDFITRSRFIYYGRGTRNEYRITQFGKGFPFLKPEHTGDLFVLVKLDEESYSAFVLSTEEEIEAFLSAFGMSPAETGSIIRKDDLSNEIQIDFAIDNFVRNLEVEFPTTSVMSKAARDIFNLLFNNEREVLINPDKMIVSWTEMEYKLFRRLEYWRYGDIIQKGFSDVESFVKIANMVLNRRKSRAGRSLENHLAEIFDKNKLKYEEQVKTEGNRKPDFIFPGGEEYHNLSFPKEKLIFLGAKTTCKDRWRQIINEANRIDIKYLFTLQQGISSQQLSEMSEEKVVLVIPAQYLGAFPRRCQSAIFTLKNFIDYVKETQS